MVPQLIAPFPNGKEEGGSQHGQIKPVGNGNICNHSTVKNTDQKPQAENKDIYNGNIFQLQTVGHIHHEIYDQKPGTGSMTGCRDVQNQGGGNKKYGKNDGSAQGNLAGGNGTPAFDRMLLVFFDITDVVNDINRGGSQGEAENSDQNREKPFYVKKAAVAHKGSQNQQVLHKVMKAHFFQIVFRK